LLNVINNIACSLLPQFYCLEIHFYSVGYAIKKRINKVLSSLPALEVAVHPWSLSSSRQGWCPHHC